jgi:uncharacterized protein YutE (UPF0331/DUF86 family)
MDRNLITRKLDSLARCVRRIEIKRPLTPEHLVSDIDLQDILSVNIERAVQLCVDIGAHLLVDLELPPPETMGEVFQRLADHGIIPTPIADALRKAVGFRNLSVHAYDRVDWERVYEITHHRMNDFRLFAAHVVNWTDQGNPKG